MADLAACPAVIDPELFHEPAYDERLARLIGHVLASEAPIAEDLLVERIARAHGFQRTGRAIRDRVMEIAAQRHCVDEEADGGRFIWMTPVDREGWDRARPPASADDIRLIEDIALVELGAARRTRDTAGVARLFGIRSLSAAARERIETA